MERSRKNEGIFTALGAATGLGNALRFPSLCALYGGAFLFAYAACLALVCYPLLCAELHLGKRYAQSFDNALGMCAPKFKWLAYCAAANCAIIALYYGVISAKLGGAFLHIAVTGGVGDISGISLLAVGALSITAVFLILHGAPNRLARTGKVAVISSLSLLAALLIAVFIKGGNAFAVFEFALSDFLRGGLWADALGQSLLALSLAGGVMPTFAHSLGRNFSVALTAIKIIAANLIGCLLAALSTLAFALPVPEGGGVIVALELYPRIIATCFENAVAFRIFGMLFFLSLWLVSVQSACSLFSPALSLAPRKFRLLATASACFLAIILLPLFAANGGAAMLAVDRMACSVSAVIIAFIEAKIFSRPVYMCRRTQDLDKFTNISLRFFCPVACGALALFSACSARFSCYPPYASACAFASLVFIFSLPAVRLACIKISARSKYKIICHIKS